MSGVVPFSFQLLPTKLRGWPLSVEKGEGKALLEHPLEGVGFRV